MNPSLAPRCRTGDLDANIETAPSHGSNGFVIDVSRRRCCHRRQASRLKSRLSTSLDRFGLRSSGDDHSHSVSYRLDTPTSPAVARRRRQLVSASDDVIAFGSIRKRPADVGSGRNPAATLPSRRDPHRPCQTRDSRYLRNAERADWPCIATRLTPDDAPRKPRRVSPAPATSRVSMLRTSNLGVDSRRAERVATLVAEQHASRSTTEPNSTGLRTLRAEAHSSRSPASPGGLDASADTDRRN
jgi:hypothetical protein